MLEMAGKCSIMLEIEDYAFPFGLCFSRPIMLKIMLAYCINAYPRFESGRGRCVESLDKALYSHCPKEKPSH